MSFNDNGSQQPNADADTTAHEMDNAPDIDPKDIEGVRDESAKKLLSSTAAQKKHWRDKAKSLEAELERIKSAPAPVAEPEKKPKAKATDFDPEAFEQQITEKLALKQSHQGFDDSDYAKAKVFAQAEGKTVSDVVASPFFQAYLNDKRSQAASERAGADPSSRTGNSSRDWSRYEENPSLIRSMSAEDHKQFIAWQKAKGRK